MIETPTLPTTLPTTVATATTTATVSGLRNAYREARAAGASRHRDIAAALAVSEGALIAAHVGAGIGGLHAQRLKAQWPAIVAELHTAGEVMALTRNAACVHEKTGVYDNASGSGLMGLVLGGAIDLRIFYSHWAHGFAVEEQTPNKGVQRSLQFFDAHGTALHKVFVKPATDLDAWTALIQQFADEQTDADAALGLQAQAQAPKPRAANAPDASIDLGRFHEGWAGLRDTHEFFDLLKKHHLSRTQALRLAEPRFAQALDAGSAREALRAAVASATPIMVFVGNPGIIQIHSGAVKRVEVMGPWLNVLDADFNLHLREDHIAQAWAVRKPTVDGLVSSLEFFDAQGETIAMFFGERKPGRAELCGWRQIVSRMVGDSAWQADEQPCSSC